MPAIYEKKLVPVFVGLICDVCGVRDDTGCSDFVLKHTFGYGSPIDGASVEAAICDECLERLIRKHVLTPQFNYCPG